MLWDWRFGLAWISGFAIAGRPDAPATTPLRAGPLLPILTNIAGLVFGREAVRGSFGATCWSFWEDTGRKAIEAMLAGASSLAIRWDGGLPPTSCSVAAVGRVVQLKDAMHAICTGKSPHPSASRGGMSKPTSSPWSACRALLPAGHSAAHPRGSGCCFILERKHGRSRRSHRPLLLHWRCYFT